MSGDDAGTSAVAGERPRADRWPWVADRRGRAIELFTMCGLAIAQPVFAVVGSNVAELVARRVGALEVIAFALAVLCIPPAVLYAVEAGVAAWRPAVLRILHPAVLGVLFGAFVLQLVGDAASGASWVLLGVAALVAVLFARLYRTMPPLRVWLRYLAVACVVFLVSFLALSPVRRVAFAPSIEPVDTAALPARPPDVVVVVLDELPALSLLRPDGTIDAERVPAFARLADTSTWYRNATAVASWTVLAVPSIFTGRYPEPELGPMATDHPDSLFRLLGTTHDFDVHETATRICPEELCPADEQLPSSVERVGGLLGVAGRVLWQRTSPFEEVEVRLQFESVGSSTGRMELLRDVTGSIEAPTDGDGAPPSLDVVHVGLPHQPWTALPSTATHDGPDVPPGLADGNHWLHDLAAGAAHQAHLRSLQATDLLLGELLDRLESTGRFDDALVIVTADHGAAFVGGAPFRAITDATADQVAYVPLFVKLPGQTAAEVDDAPVQTVDIVPTIADVVGIDLPWAVDGVSLLEEGATEGRPHRFRPVWLDEVTAGADGLAELESVTFDDRVARNAALLEDLAGEAAVQQLPGGAPLIGAEVDDLTVDDTDPPTGTIAFAGQDRTVSPDAPVPAFVLAGFDDVPSGSVAVAVDGTVVLTGPVAAVPGRTPSFWGLLPEEALGDGRHRVELYEVTGSDDAPVLRPVTLRPGT